MLTKKVKYVDYNGQEQEENIYFNLTEAELNEMQLEAEGGLGQRMQVLADKKDIPQMKKLFKGIILRAYGQRSLDGKRFIKTKTVSDENGNAVKVRLADEFEETEAYSQIFTELLTNADAAVAFFTAIIPEKFRADFAKATSKKQLEGADD